MTPILVTGGTGTLGRAAVRKLTEAGLPVRLPHTILRATQFHDLVHKVLAGAAKLPVMPLPTISAQPVDVRDVATQLPASGVAVGVAAAALQRAPDA
jgi:uncharacterized protein YbjT (DUF2867 family)